jgi:hypothetical protein
MFGDQLSYTSQSPFGFGGLGGLNNLGVGLGNGVGSTSQFRPGFLPDQSILINGSPQLSNAAIGEVDYALSHRSSLTFAGSYDNLYFVNSGFHAGSSAAFQGGYNHSLDRMNSIAVFYGFSEFMFGNLAQKIQNHSVQISYARRITGRLSFQVGAGPMVELFRSPLAGPGTVATWTASASLNYQHRHTGTALNYNHLATGGSGVLAGASTDLFSGSMNHSFNRDWEGEVSSGYSRNHALQQTTPNASTISPQGWFATARVSRHFVRYGSLYVSYGVSGETGLGAVCTLPACTANSLAHTVAIGYNWGLRPVVLE